MSGPGIADPDDEDDFDRLFKKTVEVMPSKEDDFDRLFKQTMNPSGDSKPTADMPDRQPSQPLVGGLGPSPGVAPKPLTEDTKNPNDPPTDDGWIGALTSAFKKMNAYDPSQDKSLMGAAAARKGELTAGAAGAAHGFTMGTDQMIPGYGDDIRAAQEAQRAQSPTAYGVGDFVGSMLNPVNALGKAKGLAGLAGNVANGAVQSGVRSYSDAPAGSDDAAITALKDAGYGAVGSAAASGVAKAAGGILGGVANVARRQAWGVGAPEMEAYAAREGLPINAAKRQFVQEGERVVPPNTLVPRDAGDWQVAGKQATSGLNSQIEGTLDEAAARGAQLPPDPRAQIARNLYQQADTAATSGFNTAQQSPLSATAQAVERGPQSMTPMDLRAQKIGFDRNAFGGAPGTPESLQGQANLAAGNQYRGMLNDYVAQGGDDLAQQFGQQSNDFGIAATIRDASGRLGARNNPMGQDGGMLNRALSMVPGTGMVSDAVANTGRLGERVTNWIGDMAPNAVTRMREQMIPDPRMQGGPSSMNTPMQGIAPPDSGRDDMQPGPATPQWYGGGRQGNSSMGPQSSSSTSRAFEQGSQMDDSQGQDLTENFLARLRANPEQFSAYGYQIDQLASKEQIAPWLEKMTRTSPGFARNIYQPLVNGEDDEKRYG